MRDERDDGAFVTTERLLVRRWQLDEIERFFDIYRRAEVVRWLGGEPMADRSEGIEMIERWYHEPHLMFWKGATAHQQPTIEPTGPHPTRR